MANDTPMRTNDLDRDVMNQDADFILGTSLAGWLAGRAPCRARRFRSAFGAD